MDRATLLNAKSTISQCPPSLITISHAGNERLLIANCYAQTEICRLGLLPLIWTIMLKLHLVDLLSTCYTANFATNTVTNQTMEL